MALVLVFLLPAPLQGIPPRRQAPTTGGRPRGRCGFSIISPRRATCGRRRRGWGCRGSRLTCCGGGTGSSGRGGRRLWRWRGGMSRKCWRRGRSMASRSRCSITASRWRCGGGTIRGCSWRIWRGSTGRRGRMSRARGWRISPGGSTRCWRCWRARLRRRTWSARPMRVRGRWRRRGQRRGPIRSCRWRARSMSIAWPSLMPRRLTRRGWARWRRARPDRRTSRTRVWASGGRWRGRRGMSGRTGLSRRSMRCAASRAARAAMASATAGRRGRLSSSRWTEGRGRGRGKGVRFRSLDRVNLGPIRGAWVRGRRRMFGSSGNPAGGTMLL